MSGIYLSQRTNRHVIKHLSPSHSIMDHFGVWQTPKTDTTGLNFPWGIATDGTYIYCCDNNNKRIMKIHGITMDYVSSVNVANQVGRPFSILYDSITSDLYVTGIYNYRTVSIARITTSLVVSKFNNNIAPGDTNDHPMGISRGFASNDFIISGLNIFGVNKLLKTTENGNFSTAVVQSVHGENVQFTGNVKHSNGDMYMLKQRAAGGSWLCRVTDGYINVGDSNKISKNTWVLSLGNSGTLIAYDYDNCRILRYDENLNFVESIYSNHSALTCRYNTNKFGAFFFGYGSPMNSDVFEIYGLAEI